MIPQKPTKDVVSTKLQNIDGQNDSSDNSDFDDTREDFQTDLYLDYESDDSEDEPVKSMVKSIYFRYQFAENCPTPDLVDSSEQTSAQIATTSATSETSKKDVHHLDKSNLSRIITASGITNYAVHRIDDSALSTFKLLIDDSLIFQIVDATNANEKMLKKGVDLPMPNKILALIGVEFVRTVCCRNGSIEDMWSEDFGIPIVKKLMSKNKFVKMRKLFRFDDKTRDKRTTSDKFEMIRPVWDKFVENLQKCFFQNLNLAIDEQFLTTSSKTHYPFEQKYPTIRLEGQVWKNLLNLAGIYSHILYRAANNSKISRKQFLLKLIKEIVATVEADSIPNARSTPSTSTQAAQLQTSSNDRLQRQTQTPSILSSLLSSSLTASLKRKIESHSSTNRFSHLSTHRPTHCQIRECRRNKSIANCCLCEKSICGRCTYSKDFTCVKCNVQKQKPN